MSGKQVVQFEEITFYTLLEGFMSGFLVGVVFGYLLKRSRLCFTAGFRDIYLEKKNSGLLLFLTIMFVQSVVYFGLVFAQKMPPANYENFSVLATILGGLLFGLGAILANGCITSSLIKTGDGRFVGFVSLGAFSFVATASKGGILSNCIKHIQQNYWVMEDNVALHAGIRIYFFIIPVFILLLYVLYRDVKKRPKKQALLPSKYTGLKHYFFEVTWDARLVCIPIGVIAGLSFYLNYLFSSESKGWGLTSPLVGVVTTIVGGSTEITWGTFFVVGIILGSFLCAYGSEEFSIKGTDGGSLMSSLFGGVLMGVGSVLAKGCIIGNGLTGAAMMSIRSWIGIFFIVIGIWIGTYLKLVRPYK